MNDTGIYIETLLNSVCLIAEKTFKSHDPSV